MQKLNGEKIAMLPLEKPQRIADLVYFEGALVSWFIDATGESYLFCWCDADETFNRWLVFNVQREQLQGYLKKTLSLRDLVLEPNGGFLYAVDVDDTREYGNVYLLNRQALPVSYLPAEDAYHAKEDDLTWHVDSSFYQNWLSEGTAKAESVR